MKSALVLAFAFLTACSDSMAPVSAPGLWELTSINGQPLPFTLIPATSTAPAFIVTDGQYNLGADGTYTHSVQYGPHASFVEQGTYTVQGGSVRLVAQSNGTYSIPLNSSGLTKTVEGRQYRYQK